MKLFLYFKHMNICYIFHTAYLWSGVAATNVNDSACAAVMITGKYIRRHFSFWYRPKSPRCCKTSSNFIVPKVKIKQIYHRSVFIHKSTFMSKISK